MNRKSFNRRLPRSGVALALLGGMLGLYHVNGDFLPGNDATANLYLSLNLLQGRGLSFRPEAMPQMFIWQVELPAGECAQAAPHSISPRTVRIHAWDRPIDSRTLEWLQRVHTRSWQGSPTWQQLHQQGWLRLVGPEYYLVPSQNPEQRGYVNQYGPGAGLTALPMFALLNLWIGNLEQSPAALWYGGKFLASLCVALSVSFVYLTLCRLTNPIGALMIAILYGTGTCVWSMSSQTLWQSGPNILFLSLAVYCLAQGEKARSGERHGLWMVGAGLSAAWAVVCRPTSALLVLAVGGFLLGRVGWAWWKDRFQGASRMGESDETVSLEQGEMAGTNRRQTGDGRIGFALRGLVAFVLGGLPVAVFLGAYNTYYLGAPWRFGQVEVGRRLAQDQLGTPEAWSGNFLEGLYGQVISPARGLLVYSPILVFSFWGMGLAWRHRRYRLLQPLGMAVILLLLVQSKWFNWHGGWSFGYRLMVDAMPLAAVCSAPTVRLVRRYWGLAILAGVLAFWSVGIQILGAFAYDVVGWNCREGVVVRLPDGRAVPVHDRQEAIQLVQQTGGAVQKVLMDVDRRPWKARLWSIQDNPIGYYLTHWHQSRQRKHQLMEFVLQPP